MANLNSDDSAEPSFHHRLDAAAAADADDDDDHYYYYYGYLYAVIKLITIGWVS